ncbi:MAG: 50S ribosomal protein L10 [Candidatus Vogelbacteria bacterium]
MPIKKEKKVEIIKELGQKVGSSETVVFVNFHGLSVANATALRRQLRERGVGYTVAKKTLIRRAIEASGRAITGTLPNLDGEVALAYLTVADGDPIAPAKGIYEFSAKGGPASGGQGLKILGGVFQGAFAGAEMMMSIAAIPPRETLYAQLANLFNSPIQRLVVALDQISKTKS